MIMFVLQGRFSEESGSKDISPNTQIYFKIPPHSIPQKIVEKKNIPETSDQKHPIKRKTPLKAKTRNRYAGDKKETTQPPQEKTYTFNKPEKLKQGKFPALTLSYNNPEIYIKQMYHLGAKTILYNVHDKTYHEINLIHGQISPFKTQNFHFFSSLKRVIDDPEWKEHIFTAKTQLGAPDNEMELLLLVPLNMETRWMTHIINKIGKKNINIKQVITIEGQFENAKLKIVKIHLKNGIAEKIYDGEGV